MKFRINRCKTFLFLRLNKKNKKVLEHFKKTNLFSACSSSGFSLLEVVFSIAIITVGVISILTIFNFNLKTEINNKNKLIATYLAEESIEVVRQDRDNTWFGKDFNFLDNSEFRDGKVIVFPTNPDVIQLGWTVEALKVSPGTSYKEVYLYNGYYVQRNSTPPAGAGWTDTGFERYLTIDNNSLVGSNVNGCDITSCVRIISHVSFDGKELVTLTAYLYDGWY